MISGILLLSIWLFWLLAIAGAIRSKVSWYPSFAIIPAVFFLFGIILDRFIPVWGAIVTVSVHTCVIIFPAIVLALRERYRRGTGRGSVPHGGQPEEEEYTDE
jgi:hypothetical protein